MEAAIAVTHTAMSALKQVNVKLITSLGSDLRVPEAQLVRSLSRQQSPHSSQQSSSAHSSPREDPPQTLNIIFTIPSGAAVQAVPADVTRYGLSTIINHMLKLGVPRPLA